MFHREFLSLSQCTTKVFFISFQLCIGVHTHCQTDSFSVQMLMASISCTPSIWPVAKPTNFSFEMLLKHTPVSLARLPISYAFHILIDSGHFSWSSHSPSLPFSKAPLFIIGTQSVHVVSKMLLTPLLASRPSLILFLLFPTFLQSSHFSK